MASSRSDRSLLQGGTPSSYGVPRAYFVRRAANHRFLGAAMLVVTSSLGCSNDGSSGAATTAAFDPEPIPSARRPTKRYFLSRTAERCEIFSEDGADRSEPFVTPCPEYVLIGERIRIAGRTCFIVNRAQPEREKPVICPDPLTRFEKHDRGEEKLPQ